MFRTVIIFAFFSFFFTACETEVEIDIERIPSKLVVISNFSSGNVLEQDSSMRVTVSRTAPALANNDTLITIPDAVVELWQGPEGDEFVKRLDYTEPTAEEAELGLEAYYTSGAYTPEAGTQYTIEVSVPGSNLTPVKAVGQIPELIAPHEAEIVVEETTTANGFKDVNFQLDLSIRDFAGVSNFYHLNLYQEINRLRFSIDGDTIERTPFLIGPLTFALTNNDQEVLPYINNQGALIKDKEFDGNIGEFSFRGNFPYNPASQELGVFIVELRNTSEEYYLYHASLVRQNRVQSGFDAISGAVVLFNNIENGCGVFAGYSPVFTTLDLSD